MSVLTALYRFVLVAALLGGIFAPDGAGAAGGLYEKSGYATVQATSMDEAMPCCEEPAKINLACDGACLMVPACTASALCRAPEAASFSVRFASAECRFRQGPATELASLSSEPPIRPPRSAA